MPYKPTGRPVGRPLKEEPRLLTYSFKADPVLMEEAKEYAWRHRTSVGELIRDGLKWRLEEGGDPLAYRYVAPPVQTTISNIVIPESEKPVPPGPEDLEDMPIEPAPVAPQPALDYDHKQYKEGEPCKKAHHQPLGEGRNLRYLVSGACVMCKDPAEAEEPEH